MKRDGNGNSGLIHTYLHDSMAAALADFNKSILLENAAHLLARKDSELTQPAPQPEL